MKEFLYRYKSLFIWLIIWMAAGRIASPLSLLIMVINFFTWYNQRRYDVLFLALLLILSLGDSRLLFLGFFKDLRIAAQIFLAWVTLQELQKAQFRLSRVFASAFPFMIWAYISMSGSPVLLDSFSKTTSYVLLLFVIAHYLPILMHYTNNRILLDIGKLIIVILVAGFILYFINPTLTYLYGYRGVFGNPNGLGIFCTLSTAYLFMLYFLFPKSRKTILFGLGLVLLSAFLSQSRTTLVAVLLFSIALFVYASKNVLLKFLFWIVFIFMVFGFNLADVQNVIAQLGLSEELQIETIEIAGGRTIAWNYAWPEVLANFWMGKGFGYTEYFFEINRNYFYYVNHQGNMHNSYLTFIMDIGIIGLFFWIMLILKCITMIPYNARFLLIPFLLAVLVSSNFESWLTSSLNSYTIYFFLCFALLINYNHIKYPTPSFS